MPETVDVIVLGMGPGGETAASRLLEADQRVAVIERELIGGECAYWACIPSKTLRPPEVRSEADREPGVATPALDWPSIAAYRDWMTRHLDDQAQARGYQEQGALVVRGAGRLVGPGQVQVDGQRLQAEQVALATGPSRSARRSRGWTRSRSGPTGRRPSCAPCRAGPCWSAAARSESSWGSCWHGSAARSPWCSGPSACWTARTHGSAS
jgi:pyruvate/2-oxoglutarate dehydrogenase complex dihydrolipoamide dehydrogenase (E3) component